MNYERPYRGGGGRRRYRDREDYDTHDRRPPYESPEQILKNSIIRLGEVDPIQEVSRLAKQLHEDATPTMPAISEGIRIAVTEQPYKIPYYAALLRLLHGPGSLGMDTSTAQSSTPLGKQVLEDFWKGFQGYLDKLSWRHIRLCIHFFAHLTVAQVISTESMAALLQSFAAVLDEFGVSYGRGKHAALCAAEGLMIAGAVIQKSLSSNTGEIIAAIHNFNESMASSKNLVQPLTSLTSSSATIDYADELLDSVITVLKALETSEFADPPASFPQPYLEYEDLDPATSPPFELPSILVPPEVIELDGLSSDDGEDAQVKRDEWPEFWFRLFDNAVTPDLNTISGFLIRSNLRDMIDIFEVNRKECARLLLEYPKWCVPGTFKPRAGGPPIEDDPSANNWQLESVIIEATLGYLFLLPDPGQKPVYFIALITELCKLSPSTVGPAVGKSIRRLYNCLAEGLDVEVARRFVEWFAVHMSNFGFQWVWKEWIPDLVLPENHPKRTFVRRAVESEIRLSYHERILKALPEAMQDDPNVISSQQPGPDPEYEEPSHPYHDAYQSVLSLLRGRSRAEEVIAQLDTLKTTLDTSHTDMHIDSIIRSLAIQSLLSIGSRSFSHFLNAIERYLPLLRGLAMPTDLDAKRDILAATAAFWKRNRHMVGIVFDKLMQYQIVDPTDIVAWIFNNTASGDGITGPVYIQAFEWELLKGALDKANGRVTIARKKVVALRKEQDDSIARAKASGGADVGNMEVDGEMKPLKQDESAAENPQLTTALKAFTSLTREQKSVLAKTLEGFVSCLSPVPGDDHQNTHAKTVVEEHAWERRASWTNEEWMTWETWGWYRHFCRLYSPYLRNYSTTLSTVAFAKIEGFTTPTAQSIKKFWDIATGQEA
ncbi:MIF4G like-domain-containing protein [Pisolithus marmoratus]|nr:MIF4G like-domain-containing protein [Pisolithus marmoratus]